MSFLTDNPMVGKTKELGDNLPILGDRNKAGGKPAPTNPSKSQPAAGVVTTGGQVLSPSGGAIGTVIKGPMDSLVGKPVTPTGEVLGDDGQVVGEVQMVDVEQQDETHSNADSGVHGVMEEDNKPDPNETEQRRDIPKKWPEVPISSNHPMSSKPSKLDTMPGGPYTKTDVPSTKVGTTTASPGVGVDPKIDPKKKKGLTEMEPVPEPEVEKKKGPMAGRKVNREGNVVDENGDPIGKLTTGELSICLGKGIDDDGDVVDSKGNIIGHVSLLADIPPNPEPTESPKEKEKREQMEQDKKLAAQMATCLDQCLDKIRPICRMITQILNKAERTPKEELDEEDVVNKVKPLLEEGSRILNESNGIVRGLDPDGRIAANAKDKTAAREATPEEYRLADVLKELTGTVTECIENAKCKVEDMPHAKKELNPLWGLLTEPLFQILAAVGLLLNGVLGLVGRLLSGLGLGGLVENLLGGLGLTRLLEGLGLGGVVPTLTGKK